MTSGVDAQLRVAGHAELGKAPLDPVDPTVFRATMGAFATGVTIVTVRCGDDLTYGMTVNSFASVSLDPALVLVCLAGSGRGLDLIEDAGVFGINVLSREQEGVSRWFADRRRPADSTMFDGVAMELGATGCPRLIGAAAIFDCQVHRMFPAGDHRIVVGQVMALAHRPDSDPLVFHAGRYGSLDHDPVAAGRARLHVVRGGR